MSNFLQLLMWLAIGAFVFLTASVAWLALPIYISTTNVFGLEPQLGSAIGIRALMAVPSQSMVMMNAAAGLLTMCAWAFVGCSNAPRRTGGAYLGANLALLAAGSLFAYTFFQVPRAHSMGIFMGWLVLALGVGVPAFWIVRYLGSLVVDWCVVAYRRMRKLPDLADPSQGNGEPAHHAMAERPAASNAEGQVARHAGIEPTKVTRNMASIAGMADLKRDLEPVLTLFATPANAKRGQALAVPDRNGVLFSGPPGNGKTSIAEAMAGELKLPFFKIGVQDVTSKWVNESPEKVTAVFDAAIASAPSVLFIDEIDAAAPSRVSGAHQEDVKLVNTLLQQIDRLRKHRVLLIAATNHVENIDAAVVRDGRFDFRIEIPWPDEPARLGMLQSMSAKHQVHIPEDVALRAAHRWERRSAAFIENVVKRLRDVTRTSKEAVTLDLVRQCDREVSKRAGNLPSKGPKLSDIYLLPSVRQDAHSIVNRLRQWDSIADQGGTPPRGILLFGPPGTGKTMMVNAMARELGDWHVFEVRTSEILADPRTFKKVMDRATEHRPAFVFIDEADDLLKDRGTSFNASATNEILKAMDGVMGAVPEVVFVAATNNPEAIDAAAKRSGRFSEKLFLDALRGDDLREFLEHQMRVKADKLQIDPSLSAHAIAVLIGEAGPADVLGVLNAAVNATFDGPSRRQVTAADIARAVERLRSA